jgi:hypothetical protein
MEQTKLKLDLLCFMVISERGLKRARTNQAIDKLGWGFRNGCYLQGSGMDPLLSEGFPNCRSTETFKFETQLSYFMDGAAG